MDDFDMMAEMQLFPWLDSDVMADSFDGPYDHRDNYDDDDYGPDGKYTDSIMEQEYNAPLELSY